MKNKLEITAYEVVEEPMQLRNGERRREWLEALPDRFGYRCLPLTIANQAGWEILNPVGFTARWNGKDGLDAIRIRFDGEPTSSIGSHFGHGVLTFSLGYLFRTTKSHNLWVKGPANQPKDGIAPLEGIIETDWAPFTFTMNWQFTRKRYKVRFEKDEPIATVLPYPRHYLSKFQPSIKMLNQDPKLYNQYMKWREERIQFNDDLKKPGSDAAEKGWQKSYMKGEDTVGQSFAGHETKLRIQEFKRSK